MKKLLSLLSVLTISGTAVPTTIAASPYQKEEILNRTKRSKFFYGDEHNSGNNRRRTIDRLINQYCGLCHNYLILQIDKNDLEDIFFFKDIHLNNKDALFNKIFRTINQFEKENHSADTQNSDYISNNDTSIIVNVIINHFEEIRNTFEKNSNKGLIIRTNRASYWSNNGNWWGVHTDNGNWW